MIKIVDQVDAAVHGRGEKFNMARAILTNVINGKTVEYSAVIDLDHPARAMQDGHAIVRIAATYRAKSEYHIDWAVKMKWVPVLGINFVDDGPSVDYWIDRLTFEQDDEPAYVLPSCYDYDWAVGMTVQLWKARHEYDEDAKRLAAWLKSHMSDADRKAYYADVAAKAKATKAKNKAKKVA